MQALSPETPSRPVFTRSCPECGEEFKTTHPQKCFCSTAHKWAFQNRCATRGKVLLPLAMGWRVNRGRKGIGSQCLAEMVALLDKFAEEDRIAKRPPMTVYADFLLNVNVKPRRLER